MVLAERVNAIPPAVAVTFSPHEPTPPPVSKLRSSVLVAPAAAQVAALPRLQALAEARNSTTADELPATVSSNEIIAVFA